MEVRNEYASGASPANTWAERHGMESASANPDILEDTGSNKLWGSSTPPQLASLIIERFADAKGDFPILSKRQNDVLRLYLQGMEATDIGRELKLDKRRVSTYLQRIQRRFKRLLKSVDF